MEEELDEEYEALDETAEERSEEDSDEALTAKNRAAIEAELADLDQFAQLATSISHLAQGKAARPASGLPLVARSPI